jgi:hypothetical protein
MTWANARDVNLLGDVSVGLQDQAHELAESGASDVELQKVKKVCATGLKGWVQTLVISVGLGTTLMTRLWSVDFGLG